MGAMTITCNSKQLEAILRDFEDASVPADTAYSRMHKGKTELKINYDDEDDAIVAGIVKYRMRNNED